MGYLRIKCHECGGYWEAYSYNIKDDHLRMCPHCCKEIDRQTWNRSSELGLHRFTGFLRVVHGYRHTGYEPVHRRDINR